LSRRCSRLRHRETSNPFFSRSASASLTIQIGHFLVEKCEVRHTTAENLSYLTRVHSHAQLHARSPAGLRPVSSSHGSYYLPSRQAFVPWSVRRVSEFLRTTVSAIEAHISASISPLDPDLSLNDFFPLLNELIVLPGIRFKNFSKMHAKRRWSKKPCRGRAMPRRGALPW
jgi:hypothetical protein